MFSQTRTYSQTRHAAYTAWRGPESARKDEGDDLPGGLSVLHLALRTGDSMSPVIASRGIFADLMNGEDALLRSVLWKNEWYVRHSTSQTGRVAIRFVRLPLTRARSLLAAFANVSVPIQLTPLPDDALPVRSLRIVTDSVHTTFEKTWQYVSQPSLLDQQWELVWNMMEQAIAQLPPIQGVEESFRSDLPPGDLYDFDVSTV